MIQNSVRKMKPLLHPLNHSASGSSDPVNEADDSFIECVPKARMIPGVPVMKAFIHHQSRMKQGE
ncbi:MAG: hypothetical protein WC334_03770 [Kiritimatiellales bacterium]|jgi:hypothetical protein